jgi:hypothetical protein
VKKHPLCDRKFHWLRTSCSRCEDFERADAARVWGPEGMERHLQAQNARIRDLAKRVALNGPTAVRVTPVAPRSGTLLGSAIDYRPQDDGPMVTIELNETRQDYRAPEPTLAPEPSITPGEGLFGGAGASGDWDSSTTSSDASCVSDMSTDTSCSDSSGGDS